MECEFEGCTVKKFGNGVCIGACLPKKESPIERVLKAGILEPEPRRITFLCQVPAGTQLIAVGDTIIAVAPGMEASYVTPDGLVPIMTAAERRECSSNPQKSSN